MNARAISCRWSANDEFNEIGGFVRALQSGSPDVQGIVQPSEPVSATIDIQY